MKVTGIGGGFFKSADPEATSSWYREHLGLAPTADGSVVLGWRELHRPNAEGQTIWSPFKAETTYFAPSDSEFMVNYRVADLTALLTDLALGHARLRGRRPRRPLDRLWPIAQGANRGRLLSVGQQVQTQLRGRR